MLISDKISVGASHYRAQCADRQGQSEMQDGGSGLTNQQAADILAGKRLMWVDVNSRRCDGGSIPTDAKIDSCFDSRRCLRNKKAPIIRGLVAVAGGEGGIRTLGTLQYA